MIGRLDEYPCAWQIHPLQFGGKSLPMRPLRLDNAQGPVQTGLPLDLKVDAGVCPA